MVFIAAAAVRACLIVEVCQFLQNPPSYIMVDYLKGAYKVWSCFSDCAGSYSGGDAGGMYSSSYNGDYISRGSDVCIKVHSLILNHFMDFYNFFISTGYINDLGLMSYV